MKRNTLLCFLYISLLNISCSSKSSVDNNYAINIKKVSISNYSTDKKTFANSPVTGSSSVSVNCPGAMRDGSDWTTTATISDASTTFEVLGGYRCNVTLTQYVDSTTKDIYTPQPTPLILNLDSTGGGTTLPATYPYFSATTKNVLWFAASASAYSLVINYGSDAASATGGASKLGGNAVAVTVGGVGAPTTNQGEAAKYSKADFNGIQDYQLSFGPVASPDGGTILCKIIQGESLTQYDYNSINGRFNAEGVGQLCDDIELHTTNYTFSGKQGNWGSSTNTTDEKKNLFKDVQIIIWQNSNKALPNTFGYLYVVIPRGSDWVPTSTH